MTSNGSAPAILVLLLAASCAATTARGEPAERPSPPGPTAPARHLLAPAPERNATIPMTPAGRQFSAWLAAFNSQDRETLSAYHAQHFPYAVASRDVASLERELGLSQGTGGLAPRRFESSDDRRLVVLLEERRGGHYARASLEISPEPPHDVTRFEIGPIPTPGEWLTPTERQARSLDAARRGDTLASILELLEAHYVSAETATRVAATLRQKEERGGYDSYSDAVEFADALTRDLRRLARDKHIALDFGPMPMPPRLDGPAPPPSAQLDHGFATVERLPGNVAHLVINGFPPAFDAQRQAIAEHMTAIADADAAILDLRENHGGTPPTVVLTASYFFGAAPVHLGNIYRRDSHQTFEQWTTPDLPGRRFGADKPVFVLTGPHTFSAGEGFAYDLQALGRAVVVGEETGGGAHPTQPYPVTGGFVLLVPWGESINPTTGTNWEGIGIVPDVPTTADAALQTAHRLALEELGRLHAK